MVISIGAAMLGGSIISGLAGAGQAAMSAQATKANTKMQIDWERERAKNAHQWEVEDLKAAGLNPILSAGGNGATTGGISPAMPDFSGIGQAGNQIASNLNTAAQLGILNKKNEADIDKIISDISVQDEQKDLIKAQVLKELATAKLIGKQEAETAANTMLKEQQAAKTQAEVKQILANLQTNISILKEQLKQEKTASKRKELERKIHKATWWFEFLVNNGTKVVDSGSKAITALAKSADAVIPF